MRCATQLHYVHDFQRAGVVKDPVWQRGQGVVVEVQLRDSREALECSRRQAGKAAVPDVAAFR